MPVDENEDDKEEEKEEDDDKDEGDENDENDEDNDDDEDEAAAVGCGSCERRKPRPTSREEAWKGRMEECGPGGTGLTCGGGAAGSRSVRVCDHSTKQLRASGPSPFPPEGP